VRAESLELLARVVRLVRGTGAHEALERAPRQVETVL
jgi:hypothetical protein